MIQFDNATDKLIFLLSIFKITIEEKQSIIKDAGPFEINPLVTNSKDKKAIIFSENVSEGGLEEEVINFDDIWLRYFPKKFEHIALALKEVAQSKSEEVKELNEISEQFNEILADFKKSYNLLKSESLGRSERTELVINRIAQFKKISEYIGDLILLVDNVAKKEDKDEEVVESAIEKITKINKAIIAGFDNQKKQVELSAAVLDQISEPSLSSQRSISQSSLDSNKREEDEIKAKIKEAKIKARNHIISNLAEAKNEPDMSKKILRYKDCLARAIEFTDQYFEDSTLLEVASAISLDKVAAEIFLYRDDYEPVKSQPASPKLSDRFKSMFSGASKSNSDVDQRQPEKTLFYKTLVSLDPNSQFVFISSMSRRDLKKLFLLLELDMGADPKKESEYQEIQKIVKVVELKQQDQIRELLDAAIELRAEERKNALITCLGRAIELADLYDNPAILVEVTTAILEIQQGNLITSDQLLIFRNNPLSKIFESVDHDSKQKLLSKIPDELLYKLLLGHDDKIKGLLEKEVFKRQEQEKLRKLDDIESKLKEADQKVGKDKIDTMVDYLSKVAEYTSLYAGPQMLFRALVSIDPVEQAAILSAKIDDKTLFHKVMASTGSNEHRDILLAIGGSIKELLPLVNSKSPEDKVLKDVLKAEQAKRDQAQKDELAAKRQQELEETRKKIADQEEEKRKQQEEARQLQIKIEQQKQEADKKIRDGFGKILAESGDRKWGSAAENLMLTVDFANEYGDKSLFNQMLKLVESFTPSDRRLIYKDGLDIQKTITMFNTLLQNSKTQEALELASLLPDNKRVVILGTKDTDGKTIFHKFAKLGQLELLTKAIEIIPVGEKSKILNLQDSEGKTALHYGAQRKNGIISSNGKKIASVLLENGGDVNVQDKEGKTPLHYAAEKGRAKTLNQMLQNNTVTLVDTMDNQGKTALHLAAGANNRTSATILLKNGANPYLMDKQNKSVLEYALEKGRKFFGLMTQKAKPEYKFNQNQQPETANAGFFSLLKTAIKSKVPNSVLKFLTKEKKFDLGFIDQDGNNALHLALKDGDEKSAKLLLKHGADILVDSRNKDGMTARDIACASKNPLIAKIFDKTALTTSENLRDLALKAKSESESDREKFEEGYPMVLGILTQLNHSIAILKDKTNYKGTDEFLEKEMFGGALFYLGHYFTFSDPISSKKLHDLIGIKYQDNHMITQEDEQFQAAIKDSNKREKIIDFVEKFSEEFEIKARKYGLQAEMKNKLYKVVEEIAKAGDDLSKLEFNSDSNGENINRSAIFDHFSLKNEEGKIILSYNKIDHHLKEISPTSYQITIDPKKDEVLVLKNGEQSTMSFVDLSKLVENLEKFGDNLPEILRKLHKSKGGELAEYEIGDPPKDTHTDEGNVIHHTHGRIQEDLTVKQENALNENKKTDH